MKKDLVDNSDYFFPQFPRWITHYGFALILILLVSFLVAASLVRHSRTKSFSVIITKTGKFAEFDFTAYKTIEEGQKIQIDGPFQRKIEGSISKRIFKVRGNRVTLAVNIEDEYLSGLPIDSLIICEGSYKTTEGSLLSNFFSTK